MDKDVFDCQKEEDDIDMNIFQGEKRKLIQPSSLQDHKLHLLKERRWQTNQSRIKDKMGSTWVQAFKGHLMGMRRVQALVSWINSTLKPDHIVVQSLEDDLFDGLVFHHLLVRLGGVCLHVDEIAVTSAAQLHKLEVILEEFDTRLGGKDSTLIKWNVKLIHNKDLLATIHLLVAMARCFQPELDLPGNVKVEVVLIEVNSGGIKSVVQTEFLTGESDSCKDSANNSDKKDPIEQLLKLDTYKVNTVKKAILHFVNQNMSNVGLQVADIDTQLSDGVILLLLIGQLEGFFVPLYSFNLTPVNHTEMLHNVKLVLDLLTDMGLQVSNINPNDIVSRDVIATMKILYALFKKYKSK